MRHCILHIGGHKTGSSAIQQLFMEHRDELAGRGVLYPLRGVTTGTQRNLYYQLTRGKQFDATQPTWDWLAETLKSSDCDIVVLSSEIFSTLPRLSRVPQKIARFFQRLDFDVQVVAYVRPQHEMVNSMYAQRVRLLNTAKHFAKWAPQELGLRLYDFEAALSPWDLDERFYLTVLPYTRAVKEGGALQDFLAAAGLAERLAGTRLAARFDRRNRTPGPRTVETFRRLAAEGGRGRFRKHLREIRNLVSEEGQSRGWNEEPFCGLTNRLRDRIADRFAKSNQRLAGLYLPQSWERTFAAELNQPQERNEFDPKSASEADEAAVAGLVEEVRARFGTAGKAG